MISHGFRTGVLESERDGLSNGDEQGILVAKPEHSL